MTAIQEAVDRIERAVSAWIERGRPNPHDVPDA